MDQKGSRWPCYGNRCSCVSVFFFFISELDTILLDSDAIVVRDDCATWMKAHEFCAILVSVKTHTGADITVISKPVYHSLKSRPPLMVNKTVLNLILTGKIWYNLTILTIFNSVTYIMYTG